MPVPGTKPIHQRLRFGFFPEQGQEDYAPVCKPTYQDYIHALVARGFRLEKVPVFVGEPWEFL
jgi:hypothetical protein